MLRTALWRVISFVVFSFIAVGLLNPASVFAEDTAPVRGHALYLPSVVVEQSDHHFRSYGGRFEVLPSGEVTIWGGQEIGGNPYPDLVGEGQAVIWGGIQFDKWNVVLHSKDMGDHEGAFLILMGWQITDNPYIGVRIAADNTTLYVTQGEATYLLERPKTLEGWKISRLPDVNGVKFERKGSILTIILHEGELYFEGKIPPGTAKYGAWAYSLANNGEIDPSFETHVDHRYSLSAQ